MSFKYVTRAMKSTLPSFWVVYPSDTTQSEVGLGMEK